MTPLPRAASDSGRASPRPSRHLGLDGIRFSSMVVRA